jgi:hypothetical protein
MVEVDIKFSEQAELMLKSMPNIDRHEVLKWFADKEIIIGGGDVLDYLKTEVKNG